jgi:hypothetical protein
MRKQCHLLDKIITILTININKLHCKIIFIEKQLY